MTTLNVQQRQRAARDRSREVIKQMWRPWELAEAIIARFDVPVSEASHIRLRAGLIDALNEINGQDFRALEEALK